MAVILFPCNPFQVGSFSHDVFYRASSPDVFSFLGFQSLVDNSNGSTGDVLMMDPREIVNPENPLKSVCSTFSRFPLDCC